MSVMLLPRTAEPEATTKPHDPAPLLEELAILRLENATLRAENSALRARVWELEARLGQTSANSSRPPSSDPPQAPPRPKASPSGRKHDCQPGHRGAHRALLPAEHVDESVEGSRFAERLLTVVASCRQQGRPVLDFLVATVEAALRGSSPPSLLPAGQGG